MKHIKVLFFSLGLFLSGLAVGIALTFYWMPRSQTRLQRSDRMVKHLKENLSAKLSLRPDQIAQIEPLLQKRTDSLTQIHSNTSQQVREVFDSTDQEIAKILDPQQQEKFKKLKKKRRPPREK